MTQQHPLAGRLHEGDPFEDLGLGLGAEAFQIGDEPGFPRVSQVGEALDLQLVVEQLDLLGAEPRNPQEGDESRAGLAAEVFISLEMPGRRELDDLRIEGFADPRLLLEGAVGDHLTQVARQRLKHLGCLVIGAAAERVLPVDLQECPHLVEDLGDARRFHLRLPHQVRGIAPLTSKAPTSCA